MDSTVGRICPIFGKAKIFCEGAKILRLGARQSSWQLIRFGTHPAVRTPDIARSNGL